MNRIDLFVFYWLTVLYYTYSLGLIVLTAVISVMMANMTKTQKPLSKSVQSFVQSKFVDFLGIEVINLRYFTKITNQVNNIVIKYT